jgi:hypothetical protein
MKETLGLFFNIHETPFKLSIVIFLIFYITILFRTVLIGFRGSDPKREFNSINLEMRQKFGAMTTQVRTGLYIKNFPRFDLEKNNFIVDAIIWFEFGSGQIMIDTIEKFSFENGKILRRSDPDIKVKGDKTFVKYDVLFEVKTDLRFQRYPLGDHSLSIILTNNQVSTREMFFLEDAPFDVSKQIFTSDWVVHNLEARSGFSSLPLDKADETSKSINPKVLFTINFKKTGVKKILVIFIPIFAVMFFSLFSFLTNIGNSVIRGRLSLVAITALLGYRFVIDRVIPSVGYFTTTDKIYLLLLILSFCIFVFQLLMAKQFPVSGKGFFSIDTLKTINSIAFLITISVFTVLVTYFIIW